MREPKVSVIIPLYNVEEYLRECLDSVVNQTLKDIEVICVDDGSPDRSAEIAAEYAAKYDNFKLIRKENGGQSSARNVALDTACGEYIYFLDSDDYIAPCTLEELSQKADVYDLDIVYFNAVSFFENDAIRSKHESFSTYYSRKGDYSDICSGQTMFVRMRKNREFRESPCLQFFRRAFLEQNHLRFYEGIVHEDLLYTFQCVMLAQKTGYKDKAYYFRRVHDDTTMTKTKTIRNVEGYFVAYYEALTFLRNVQIQEEAAQSISEYLYYSLYQNGCNLWNGLDAEEKKKSFNHGGVGAEHLLLSGKKNIEIKNQVKRLTQENEKLKQKLAKLEKDFSKKKASIPARIVKNIKKFFKCVSKKGCKYAVRKTIRKVGKVFSGFMVRHSAGHVKKFFACAQKKGYRYALRSYCVKLHQKIGGRTPLVSFILPVYNVEAFLPECLDTLIRQTMPHIEIICVDDGSTDRSLEILKEYAAKDRRIQVLSQKNQYAGVARNLGLSKASGEYVVFLDSDDFFEKDLAKVAYHAAKVNEADIVIFGGKQYNNTTKQYTACPQYCNEKYIPQKQPFNLNDCPSRLFQLTTPAPWTKMFRRKFILAKGLQFQALRNSNDVFFTYSALALAERIVTVNRSLVYYRVGMATNLQATKKKDPLCFYEACMAVHDKLIEANVMDKVHQTYVNTALNNCMYNLNSVMDPDARLQIYNKLRNGGFEALGILGYESGYFYNQRYFEQAQQIINFPPNEDISLSVIIPVYNVEAYLDACLESIVRCSHPDLEIICVNDGSTDCSLSILEKYAARDSRIRIINKEKNEGLLMARKAGVETATKGHIIFLDSDDYIAADLFDFVRSTLISEPADIIQFSIGVEDYSGDLEKVKWLKKALCPKNVAYNGDIILTEAYVRRSYITSLLGKVFTAEICKKVFSLLPDEHCYVGEDIFTYFFLAYFANSYVSINTKDYYFYRYGLGVTNNESISLEKFEVYCKMAKWCQHTRDVLLADNPSTAVVDAYEAMVLRMSEDCFRIFKNRIAEDDLDKALLMLKDYWKLFPSAQQMALKTLGIVLQ